MEAASGAQPTESSRPITRTDVDSGLTVMQTVYTVAMVLGFTDALERSYEIFVRPTRISKVMHPGLPHGLLIFALVVVMLLGLRFFWVPRNLYSYALATKMENLADRMKVMTLVNFPITLIHALFFFAICQSWVDLASSRSALTSNAIASLASRFVALYAGLLVLNAVWIFSLFRHAHWPAAERVWPVVNILCALVAFALFGIFELNWLTTVGFMYAACGVFLLNCLFDLFKAAPYYILFQPLRETS
jgi:hypothetical protein